MSFKSLACAVSVQCQEIKQALASISYFDTWDAHVVAECCRVSSILEYPTESIILGPGIGTSHTVFFILEGVCRMVQNLHVEIKTNSRGKELHKLYKVLDSKTINSKSTNRGYSSRLFNQKLPIWEDKKVKEEMNSEIARKLLYGGKGERRGKEEERRKNERQGKEEERRKDEPKALDVDAEESKERGQVEGSTLSETVGGRQSREEFAPEIGDGSLESEEKPEKPPVPDRSPDSIQERSESEKVKPLQGSEPKEEFLLEPDNHLKILEECKKRREAATQIAKKGALPEKPKNVESFFVQIGFLFKGACFGLEKCQQENFIMSTTKVKCLKIPRRFLFRHNPRYTWNRIVLFHSLHLPGDEKILQSLRSDRTWMRKKEQQIAEIVSRRGVPACPSAICQVPYSVRLLRVG